MKRKFFKNSLVIAILSVILSMLFLTGCKSEPTPTPQPDPTPITKFSTAQMAGEIIEKLKISQAATGKFGFDVDATCQTKDDVNATAQYDFIAKGNVDITNTAKENDTAFVIELSQKNGDNKNVMLGLAYEVIDNEPYLFINLADGGYRKIDGFSIMQLVKLIKPDLDLAAGGTVDFSSLIAVVAPVLFDDYGTKIGGVYTFNFDMSHFIANLVELAPTINSFLKLPIDIIDTSVKAVFGDLTYVENGETIAVSSLKTFVRYAEINFGAIKGDVVFAFDTNSQALINAKVTLKNGDTSDTLLTLNKAEIGDIAVNAFENFIISLDERRAMTAINLLNFAMEGTVKGVNRDGETLHTYKYIINSDINPFVLLPLIAGKNVDIKELGYFNLTVNEVFSDKAPVNMVIIHSDFATNRVIVNFDPHDTNYILDLPIALGGVYDFDALSDIIGMLSNAGGGSGGGSGGGAEGDTTLALVNKIIGAFDFTNIKDGANIDVNKLADTLLMELLGNLDNKALLMPILGSADFFNVKVDRTTFGTCERVAEETIKSTLRKDGKFNDYSKDFIKEITNVDVRANYEFGESKLEMANTNEIGNPAKFAMTGKNLVGETVNTTGYIMASTFDGAKAGAQQVTMYIAIDTDINKTLSLAGSVMGLVLDTKIPICGVLKYTTTVTVMPNESATATTKTNATKTKFLANPDIENTVFNDIASGYPKFVSFTITSDEQGERTYKVYEKDMSILDEDGKDVTAEVLSGGKFIKHGVFTLQFKYASYTAKMPITVSKLSYETVDGGEDIASIKYGDKVEPFIVKETLADGTVNILTPQSTKYKVGGKTFGKLEEFCDSQTVDGKVVYTLKFDNNFYDTDFYREITVVAANGASKKIVTQKIKVGVPDGVFAVSITKDKDGVLAKAPKQNQTLNNFWSVIYNNEVYGIYYKEEGGVGDWYAKTESGKLLDKAVVVTLTLKKTGAAVILNSEGKITNFLNDVMENIRSTDINYTVAVDSVKLAGTFKVYEVYASKVYSSIKYGDYLNGKVAAQYIYYEVDGVAVSLEFKYVAAQNKYAIVIKGTDAIVYDVDMAIYIKENNVVTDKTIELENGIITTAGDYQIVYSVTINGVVNKMIQNITQLGA